MIENIKYCKYCTVNNYKRDEKERKHRYDYIKTAYFIFIIVAPRMLNQWVKIGLKVTYHKLVMRKIKKATRMFMMIVE